MKRRVRFSLQTLLLSVLLIGSAMALWQHWEPWALQAVIPHGEKPVEFALFSKDETRVLWAVERVRTRKVHVTSAQSGADESVHDIEDINVYTTGHFAGRPVAVTVGLGLDNPNEPYVWDLESGERAAVLRGSPTQVSLLQLSPDGQFVFAGCVNGAAHRWDKDGRLVSSLETRDYIVRAAALSAGERVTMDLSDDTGGAWSFDAAHSPEPIKRQTVSASPDGRRAVFFEWGPPVVQQPTRKVVAGRVVAVAPTPVPPSDEISLWDIEQDKELRRVTGTGGVRGHYRTCFSPDSRRLVLVESIQPELADAVTGNTIATFEYTGVAAAQFSKDGAMVALSSERKTLLYDGVTGVQLAELPRQNRSIADLWTGGPPESYLATPGANGASKTPPPPPQFSADGHKIVAVKSPTELGVWVRRRPDAVWGLAWLPEFWATVVFAGLLIATIVRNRRRET